MNYVPSATSRNLLNRKNNVIGVVIPQVSKPFFAAIFKGISQVAEKKLNVPLVLLDRDVAHKKWDGVFVDNFSGAYESTKCLIEAGHEKIATITGDMNLTIGN